MKPSQKTCLWKERIIFFGLKKDMSQSDETAAGTRLFRLIALYAAAGQTDSRNRSAGLAVGNDLAPTIRYMISSPKISRQSFTQDM